MHGRPREPKGPKDPAKVEARRRKTALYRQLSAECLARRAARRYDAESLGLVAQLLALNPELYTLWNFRKEALLAAGAFEPDAAEGGGGGEAARAAAQKELALVEAALRKNPKSYCTWQHRKWVVEGWTALADLPRELGLCDALLRADARNFHCWSYRRRVAALGAAQFPPDGELAFTAAKINENFSNYSAWHQRSALLPRVYPPATTLAALEAGGEGGAGGAVPDWALEAEYELVRQAFFTEPADQSAWLYHRLLLGNSIANAGPGLGALLAREAAACEELLELESSEGEGAAGTKWPLLTLARLRRALRGGGGDEEEEGAWAKLAAADPMRAGYYRSVAAGEPGTECLPKRAGA